MQELKQRFENMPSEYSDLINNINNTKALHGYIGVDIFSIEPLHIEFANIDTRELQFTDDPKEIDSSSIYQCMMQNSKILFHREWFGEHCYYDGFIDHQEDRKIRQVFYIKDQEIKPIRLEILELDKHGRAKKFMAIDTYGIKENHYQYKSHKTDIHCLYYDESLNAHHLCDYQVKRSPQSGEVMTIKRAEDGRVIYDASLTQLPLEKLLEKAYRNLAQDILHACSNKKFSRKKIHCVLLEYTSQGPFPPTVALIQEKEVTRSAKQKEHPLAWLNAPDADIFLELQSEHESLYSQINSLFDKMQDEEYVASEEVENESNEPTPSQKLIIDFYIRLAKSLKLKIRQTVPWEVSAEFYVCPRDFEACNEEDYLQSVLPQKQFVKIQQTIEKYQEQERLAIENNPASKESEEIFDRALKLMPSLIQETETLPKDYWYSDEFLYFIEPFGFEMKTGRSSDNWQTRLKRKIPKSSFYYRYQMHNEKPIAITQISEDSIIRQWRWASTQNEILQIEQHCAENTIESCEILKLDNDRTTSHARYCLIIDKHHYHYDDENLITSAIWSRESRRHKSAPRIEFHIFYEHENGRIVKIYRKPTDQYDNFNVLFSVESME